MSRFGQLELDAGGLGPLPRPDAGVTDVERCLREGMEAMARGEFEPGLRWYARTLEYDPLSAAAWGGQVRCLIELGRLSEAGRWGDLALERFPADRELLALKAMAIGRAGRPGEALPFSDASVEGEGVPPMAWIARGDVLLAGGQATLADRCFAEALRVAPGDWFVRWTAARARAHWRHFAAALNLVREAVGLDPVRTALWVAKGEYEMELGLADAARSSFRQALALKPGCREAEAGLRAAGSSGWGERVLRRWRAWRTPGPSQSPSGD